MKKAYALVDVETGRYYTGRYWDFPFSRNIKEAKTYESIEVIEVLLTSGNDNEDDEDDEDYEKSTLDELESIEIKTVFING